MAGQLNLGTLQLLVSLNDRLSGPMAAMERRLLIFSYSAVRAGRILSIGFTAPIVAAVWGSIGAAIGFETAFTGVIKTVDEAANKFGVLTPAGEKLRETLLDMSEQMPITAKGLSRIAELTGQLGVSIDHIEAYTDAIARMSVTFADVSIDNITLSMSQFLKIMGETAEDAPARFASAVTHLGNNLATTESRILDFAKRLAASGRVAGMASSDILAIGAAVASTGRRAEAGSTAIQKVILRMVEKVQEGNGFLDKFAETAGMTAQGFAKLWEKDAGEAFRRFVIGLGDAGDKASTVLKDLKLGNERTRTAFLSLANAGSTLTDAMNMSGEAWESMTAHVEESDKRFSTMQSELIKLGNSITRVAIELGTAALPLLKGFTIFIKDEVVPVVRTLVDNFISLPAPMKTFMMAVVASIAVLGPMVILMGSLAGVIAPAIPWLTKYKKVMGEVATKNGSVTKAINTLGLAIPPWIKNIGKMVAKLGVWAIAISTLYNAYDALRRLMNFTEEEKNANVIERNTRMMETFAKKAAEIRVELDRQKKLSENIAASGYERTSEMLDSRRQILERQYAYWMSRIGVLSDELEEIGEIADISLKSWEEMLGPDSVKTDAMEAINRILRRTGVVLKENAEAADAFAKKVEAMRDALMGLTNKEDMAIFVQAWREIPSEMKKTEENLKRIVDKAREFGQSWKDLPRDIKLAGLELARIQQPEPSPLVDSPQWRPGFQLPSATSPVSPLLEHKRAADEAAEAEERLMLAMGANLALLPANTREYGKLGLMKALVTKRTEELRKAQGLEAEAFGKEISRIFDTITNTLESSGSVFNAFRSLALKTLKDVTVAFSVGAKGAAEGTSKMKAGLMAAGAAFSWLTLGVAVAGIAIAAYAEKVKKSREETEAWDAAMRKANNTLRGTTDDSTETWKTFQFLTLAFRDMERRGRVTTEVLERYAVALYEAAKAGITLSRAQQEILRNSQYYADRVREVENNIAEYHRRNREIELNEEKKFWDDWLELQLEPINEARAHLETLEKAEDKRHNRAIKNLGAERKAAQAHYKLVFEALDDEKGVRKGLHDAIIEDINGQIAANKKYYDGLFRDLDDEKKVRKGLYDIAIRSLDDQKGAVKDYYKALFEQLNEEKAKKKDVFDVEISLIDRRITAIKDAQSVAKEAYEAEKEALEGLIDVSKSRLIGIRDVISGIESILTHAFKNTTPLDAYISKLEDMGIAVGRLRDLAQDIVFDTGKVEAAAERRDIVSSGPGNMLDGNTGYGRQKTSEGLLLLADDIRLLREAGIGTEDLIKGKLARDISDLVTEAREYNIKIPQEIATVANRIDGLNRVMAEEIGDGLTMEMRALNEEVTRLKELEREQSERSNALAEQLNEMIRLKGETDNVAQLEIKELEAQKDALTAEYRAWEREFKENRASLEDARDSKLAEIDLRRKAAEEAWRVYVKGWDERKEAAEVEYRNKTDALNLRKDEENRTWKEYVKDWEIRKEAAEEARDGVLAGIEKRREAEDLRHSSVVEGYNHRKEALDNSESNVRKIHELEMERINTELALIAKERAAADVAHRIAQHAKWVKELDWLKQIANNTSKITSGGGYPPGGGGTDGGGHTPPKDPGDAPVPPGGFSPTGYANGSDWMNFHRETVARLHNIERVQTPRQAATEVAKVAQMSARQASSDLKDELRGLRKDVQDLKNRPVNVRGQLTTPDARVIAELVMEELPRALQGAGRGF